MITPEMIIKAHRELSGVRLSEYERLKRQLRLTIFLLSFFAPVAAVAVITVAVRMPYPLAIRTIVITSVLSSPNLIAAGVTFFSSRKGSR